MRVAVDDQTLRAPLVALGHEVEPVTDGFLAELDAVVLVGDGAWDRVRGWRAGGQGVPVVVHDQRAPPRDRARLEPVVLVRSLDSQALAVGLEAASIGRPAGRVELEGGVADLDRRRFEGAEGPTSLSPLECRLLGYLAARSGRAISREELQLQVWDHRKAIATRAVDMSVMRLRKKIEPEPSAPTSLLTAVGGYRLLVRPTVELSLPATDTPLVGRGPLLARVRKALTDHAAVLLVGPPGVGKSRVLLALAEGWPGPVCFADLAEAVDAQGVAAALAAAARVDLLPGTEPDAALDAVCARLPEGALLAVDHLDDRPELVAALAQRHGSVLAASRTSVGGVALCEVPPLTADATGALVLDRAERAGIRVERSWLEALLPVLDGLPLAAELVAANLRVLGAVDEAVVSDLALDLAAPHDPERTLARAIGRSWRLLGPPERQLLATLAVFRGSVDLAVVRGVGGPGALVAWSRLVRGSLVQPVGGRFRVLHGIRRFAERAEPEAFEAGRGVHVTWMASRAVDWLDALDRPGAAAVYGELVGALDDLEAAWRTALERGTEDALVALTEAVDRVWWRHGTRAGRHRLLQQAEAGVHSAGARARLAYLWARWVAHDDRTAAIVRYEEAVEQADGVELAVRAALGSARTRLWTEGPAGALARLERIDLDGCPEALALEVQAEGVDQRDRLGQWSVARVQGELAQRMDGLLARGEIFGAVYLAQKLAARLAITGARDPVALMSRAVSWSRQLPDPRLLGQSLVILAMALGGRGRLDDAEAALDEAAALFEGVEPVRRWQIASVRGKALAQARVFDDARAVLEAYLGWCRDRGADLGVADAALWLACVELEADRPERAVHWTEVASQAAERASERNMAQHALLHLALARVRQGRGAEALHDLESTDPSILSTPLDRLRLAALETRAAELAGVGLEPRDLAGLAAAVDGPLGETARALLAGAPEVTPWTADPTVPTTVRLLGLTLRS